MVSSEKTHSYCERCGAKLNKAALYCSYCGTQIPRTLVTGSVRKISFKAKDLVLIDGIEVPVSIVDEVLYLKKYSYSRSHIVIRIMNMTGDKDMATVYTYLVLKNKSESRRALIEFISKNPGASIRVGRGRYEILAQNFKWKLFSALYWAICILINCFVLINFYSNDTPEVPLEAALAATILVLMVSTPVVIFYLLLCYVFSRLLLKSTERRILKKPRNISTYLFRYFSGLAGKVKSRLNLGKNTGTSNMATSSRKTNKPSSLSNALRYVLLITIIVIAALLYRPAVDYSYLLLRENTGSRELRDIAQKSGLSSKGKLLYYRADPELVDADKMIQVCPYKQETSIEFGCYDSIKNKIYILKVPDEFYKDIEYTTAAHEVLHVAWKKLDARTKKRISNLIIQKYTGSSDNEINSVRKTMEAYGIDKNVIPDELHSFFGSEVSDSTLPVELVDHYEQYFQYRILSIQAQKVFEEKVNTRLKNLEIERTRLDSEEIRLSEYKATYLDKILEYMKQNEYYGDYVRYNENLEAYNKNVEIYNRQIEAYKQSVSTFNNEVNKYNDFLAGFYPSREAIKTK